MCVIAHLPPDTRVTKTQLSKLWHMNPDGGGLAIFDTKSDTILTGKAMSFKQYWSQYRELRDGFPKAHAMLHMRIATHGKVNIDNVHPFQVDEYTWMAHNGVISACAPDHKTKDKEPRSDTRIFVEDYLPEIDRNWLDNPMLTALVDRFIGSSRLMFLTNNPDLDGNIYKFGSWTTAKEMHFSNGQGANVVELKKPKQYKTGQGHGWASEDRYYDSFAPMYSTPSQAPQYTTQRNSWAKLPYPITQKASHVTGQTRWPKTFRVSFTPWVQNFLKSANIKSEHRIINGDLEVTPPMLKELLYHIRKENALSQKRFEWNDRSQVFVCWGCDEVLNEAGACDCFTKFCADCLNFCADCECPGGWSMHPVSYKVLDDITNPDRKEMDAEALIELLEEAGHTDDDGSSNTECSLLPVPI